MQDSSDDDLTPEEAAAFAALPREQPTHDDIAEARTIRALHRAGLLSQHGPHRATRMMPLVIGAAAAAMIFLAGALFGRHAALHGTSSGSASVQVQQAGTAYVAALVRLSMAKDSERSPGIEAGAATLRAAATSLAMINPRDPIAARIRTSLSDDNHPASDRPVIWF